MRTTVRQLEPFRYSQIFDPKNLAVGGFGQDDPMALFPRNLLIHKDILQFHRRRHADGLEPISGPPMAQEYPAADPGGIEELAAGPGARQVITAPGEDAPSEFYAGELGG